MEGKELRRRLCHHHCRADRFSSLPPPPSAHYHRYRQRHRHCTAASSYAAINRHLEERGYQNLRISIALFAPSTNAPLLTTHRRIYHHAYLHSPWTPIEIIGCQWWFEEKCACGWSYLTDDRNTIQVDRESSSFVARAKEIISSKLKRREGRVVAWTRALLVPPLNTSENIYTYMWMHTHADHAERRRQKCRGVIHVWAAPVSSYLFRVRAPILPDTVCNLCESNLRKKFRSANFQLINPLKESKQNTSFFPRGVIARGAKQSHRVNVSYE